MTVHFGASFVYALIALALTFAILLSANKVGGDKSTKTAVARFSLLTAVFWLMVMGAYQIVVWLAERIW